MNESSAARSRRLLLVLLAFAVPVLGLLLLVSFALSPRRAIFRRLDAMLGPLKAGRTFDATSTDDAAPLPCGPDLPVDCPFRAPANGPRRQPAADALCPQACRSRAKRSGAAPDADATKARESTGA